jgi:hypothetical protein
LYVVQASSDEMDAEGSNDDKALQVRDSTPLKIVDISPE